MRKKDKLYTANKWNQPLFMSGPNLFGLGDQMNQIAPEGIDRVPEQSAPVNTNQGNQGGFNWNNIGKGAATAASFIPANEITLNKGQDNQIQLQRGVWDMLDPMYWMTEGHGGYKSETGEGMSNTGVALTKTGNPWLMLAGAGLKIAGDLTNAYTGTKTDEKLENRLKGETNYLQNYNSNAGSYEGLTRAASSAGFRDVYSYNQGMATAKTRRKVKEQNALLRQQHQSAVDWAENSYLNNLHNIQQEQIDNALRNYSAFGGPIDVMSLNNNDMGAAINYGFMADYLAAKQKQAGAKDNGMTNLFAGTPAAMFGEGGSIHINPKNKGKFNATKKRTGKTTEELTHSKNPLTRKRAIFAQNAAKWHHGLGGPLYIGAIPQEGVFALGGDIQMHSGDYSIGKIYDVSEKEANRLKSLGYEFTIVS